MQNETRFPALLDPAVEGAPQEQSLFTSRRHARRPSLLRWAFLNMKSRVAFVLLTLVPFICDAGPPVDPQLGSVTKQDFYFYSCVQEYMKANAIKVFDGSVGYGVEYSTLSSKALDEIYKSAEQFARTIPAPNYSDQEHGLPAVLVVCLAESKKL